ncbi:MAG: ATP-dependent RNA helicase HrpA, partial [Actinomycetota bacterium]|nr:ATP-dependent RNA helicase HrpA [Actinomycetota bacterium]
RQPQLEQVDAAVAAAERRLAARRAGVPAVRYPEQLPVSQAKDEILAAIRDHQVVIVSGETGSGKTTQLPKICLELGRGVLGMIGHTQPRRLAARSVAERVAEELGVPLGGAVGFTVRFSDRAGDDTLVRLMTDGILLTEIQRDRLLRQYDTIIVDEAHERSLNIDFILGYLKQLLPRRPDLKVVITSATIETGRFSQHFDGAPVIEVTGRTYPVEVRYRPLVEEVEVDDDLDGDLDGDRGAADARPDAGRRRPASSAATSGRDGRADGAGRADRDGDGERVRDQVQAICEAVEELTREGPGDVLVFLSGEREIRDTADAVAGLGLPNTEIVPLYARLSAAEQHRVFAPHTGRRIVLATNVAETSLTVPGIRYVVDPGTARISRYSHRTGVQRLPIEAISQASARQRAGRCGRVAEGICIRLYAEEDFLARPAFTEPEILRTNLAAVLLQMTSLGLGDIEAFPFVEPPDRRNVREGIRLLEELGALDSASADPRTRLTTVGRKLAQLPIDPRLGRMVLEADRNGVVGEVLVVAAALSIQDPRERPADAREAAAQSHARFRDERSDFLAWLNLWHYVRERQAELSSSAFRRMCKREFLSWLRVREWQDLHGQLRQVVKSLGISYRGPAGTDAGPDDAAEDETGDTALERPDWDADGVHRALLAGLLSHIGLYDAGRRDYQGARGARFAVAPGSALFKKPPRWVMAAELVETSRLWGRVAARIEPEWAEALAQHLVKRTYSEPHWEKKRGQVVAYEKVTLYGVPLVANRKVGYAHVDPELARELFIRHALVEGDWETSHHFFRDNLRLLEDVEELEHRARRRDIVVDDETLFAFYDARIPADVVSARHFDAWWKKTRRAQPDLLTFTRDVLLNATAGGVRESDYPDVWRQGDLELALSYQFEPGSEADGVTVHIPLPVLNRVRPDGFEWLVPGLREELVTALIRSLPKPLRVHFVPAPDRARAVLAHVTPREEPLLDALERELQRMSAIPVPRDAWQLDRLPDHLRMTFRVEDTDGQCLAQGKDLPALQRQLAGEVRAAVVEAAGGLERTGLQAWPGGTLPRAVTQRRRGHAVQGFPALVDEGDSVAVRVFPTPGEAQRAMWLGTRRLLLLGLPAPTRVVKGRLSNASVLALSRSPHGSPVALLDDCAAAVVDSLVAEHGGPAWDEAAYDALRDAVRAAYEERLLGVVRVVERVLPAWHAVEARLKETGGGFPLLPARNDVRAQVDALVHPGFVTATGPRRLPDLVRYLRAAEHRLEKLPRDPHRDRERMRRIQELSEHYRQVLDRLPPARRAAAGQVRWMLEELRVAFFAQPVGTAYPISEERVLRALEQVSAA